MDILSKAKQLRKNQTDAEKVLWKKLRNRQIYGYKFRRQVPIGSYIVDFMCVSIKLIIELDGGQHAEQQDYDRKRTAYLEAKEFQVVRFWNNDVLTNIDGVLESLTLTLSQREKGLKK
jgi:very-short-patch-repair endonuclease